MRTHATQAGGASGRDLLVTLGKKADPEDDRTDGQRFHDALQLACTPLPRVCSLMGFLASVPGTVSGTAGVRAAADVLWQRHAGPGVRRATRALAGAVPPSERT